MSDRLSLLRRVIPEKVQQKVAEKALEVSKNSPHILFGVGLVGFGATVVLSSRATLKVESVLDKFEENKSMMEDARERLPEKYSQQDMNQDLVILYIKTGVDFVKLYAPAIVTAGVAIACLTKSHDILSKRNAALTAAYAGLHEAFAKYRSRVQEELGYEREAEIYSGREQVTVQDSQTGERAKIVVQNEGYSPYAQLFGPGNANWTGNLEFNLFFIKCQQNYMNEMLRARGHVFLNEVYDRLGLERTSAGAVVGWVWQGNGDNYIDFGIWDDEGKMVPRLSRHEPAVWLDFNVDGLVYDKI